MISKDVQAIVGGFELFGVDVESAAGAKELDSLRWKSPAILVGAKGTFASDTWAVGMLIYEVRRFRNTSLLS